MVMKRYPNGASGEFFFMKRAPSPRPPWIELCSIEHQSENVIDFPMVQDLRVAPLGGQSRLHRPEPVVRAVRRRGPARLRPLRPRPGEGETETPFERVREAALLVRDGLKALGMPAYAKTSGSRGIHVYVPIVRGPNQKDVWGFAKNLPSAWPRSIPSVLTAEYRVSRRPAGHVLVDYNQNAWGRTLASVYSVRPHPQAAVSTPVTWKEIENGIAIEDFHLRNVPVRLRRLGDLWKPLLESKGRVRLERFA